MWGMLNATTTHDFRTDCPHFSPTLKIPDAVFSFVLGESSLKGNKDITLAFI